ncbi:MAG: hypothetical protein IKR01_07465, partial [Spirochaetales bacterium]|nr:hypothetical protein [Spirochaetales bacterium]
MVLLVVDVQKALTEDDGLYDSGSFIKRIARLIDVARKNGKGSFNVFRRTIKMKKTYIPILASISICALLCACGDTDAGYAA